MPQRAKTPGDARLISGSSFINNYHILILKYAKLKTRDWPNGDDASQDYLCYAIEKIKRKKKIILFSKHSLDAQVGAMMRSYFVDWLRHNASEKRRTEEAADAYCKRQFESYFKLTEDSKHFINDHNHVYLDFDLLKKIPAFLGVEDAIIFKLLSGRTINLADGEIIYLCEKHEVGPEKMATKLESFYRKQRRSISPSVQHCHIAEVMKETPNTIRCKINRISQKLDKLIKDFTEF